MHRCLIFNGRPNGPGVVKLVKVVQEGTIAKAQERRADETLTLMQAT